MASNMAALWGEGLRVEASLGRGSTPTSQREGGWWHLASSGQWALGSGGLGMWRKWGGRKPRGGGESGKWEGCDHGGALDFFVG